MSTKQAPPEVVRKTQVAAVCQVVTIKASDSNMARPFSTFAVTEGNRGHSTDRVSRAAAEQHHGALVAAYEKEPRR
jgi:hypothetical protein